LRGDETDVHHDPGAFRASLQLRRRRWRSIIARCDRCGAVAGKRSSAAAGGGGVRAAARFCDVSRPDQPVDGVPGTGLRSGRLTARDQVGSRGRAADMPAL
jgi:hypothetical protein